MRRLDPSELFELVTEPTPLADGRGPVLVHALDGFVDAGQVVELARKHLLGSSVATVVARFDVDQLYDYRARRPVMRFDRDHFAGVEMPELTVHALTDVGGTPYLLLSGPEPDVQWDRFCGAVRLIVEQLGVRRTIGLNAFPISVPHTRPTPIVVHATSKELLGGYKPWLGSVLVPGAMTNLLELRLGEAGREAVGLAATVPPYLTQVAFPAGAAALLRELATRADLLLPLAKLEEATAAARADVDAQVAQSADLVALVANLESSYDAAVAERDSALDADGPLPSGEELGAQLERFLAEQSHGEATGG